MPDLNSEIQQWIEFAKGDVEGHPFRGNQWSSGAGEINDKKDQIRRLISSGTRKSQIAQRTARRISNLHGDIAGKLADAGKLNEAQAHLKAADGWGKLARPPIEGEPNAWGEIGKPETNPVNMSDHALNDFEPWMNKSAEILKGDVAGHAFHGNQWTSLGDKAGAIRQADKSLSSRSTPEELRQVAQWHRDIASQHQTAAHQHEEMPHLTSASEIGQARYDALRSHAASEMGKHDAASYLHNKAAGELELAAKLKEEHLPSGSYGVLRTAQHTGKQAFSASSAVESHPVGDPEFADQEKAQMGSDLAELGKSAKTITDWRKENNSPGAHPIEAKPAFVPYTPPATPDEPMPADTSGTSGTDYGQSDDFSKAIAIWKAKQDPRYTTINVSPDHMEDWGHQGWNGVDENGVVRDAHDLDESSEEPGQMPIMGVVE